MDILLDDQEIQIKEAASEFLAGECSSALVRQVETDALQYAPALWTKFAENGWLQLCLSEKNGGEALPLTYLGLLFELAGYHIAPIPLHSTMVPAMVIDRHGSPEQQQLLQDVLAGELILSHAVAEKNGRWTTDSIVLDGRVEGNELVLNGVKSFVGSFRASQLCLVLYREAQAPHNLGAVLVPTNAQGLSSEALVSMAKDGEANLKFDNVRVPLTARIGQSASGNAVAHEVMDLSAVLYASMMAGAGRRTLDMAVAHAKQREAFGQPIGAFQAIQHLCANMVNAIDGTTMLSRLFLGRLSNRFSTFQLLWWSTIISTLCCVAMAFAHTPITLGAIVFVAGFSLGVGQPLTMSLVSQKTESSERALAVSARLMGNRFGQFLVPGVAGAVAAASGAGAVFIGLAVLLGTSIFSVKRN